ncbi:MAG: hypothetical protein N2C14_03900, partial [Planctomycetales bacterium]
LGVRGEDLATDLATNEQVLKINKLTRQSGFGDAPNVEGLITALNAKEKMVEISLGSDDGLMQGHQLDVFRLTPSSRSLAKIEIVSTRKDRAVAKILPGTMKGAIERNDHVATKLR